MTNLKHTAAPWEVAGNKIWHKAHCLAVVNGGHSRIDDKANAHLIAAAPDLLEALETAETYFAEYAAETPASEHALVHIRAAIAKAKGVS